MLGQTALPVPVPPGMTSRHVTVGGSPGGAADRFGRGRRGGLGETATGSCTAWAAC